MRRPTPLPLLLGLAACTSPPASPDQGTPKPDLSVAEDLAGAGDLAARPDLATAGPDLATAPDLARADLAPPPDLRTTDGGGGNQGGNAAIDCGANACKAPTSVCCRQGPFGAGTCIGPADNCASLRWLCDDPSDCNQGDVCCNTANGSECMGPAQCQAAMGRRMCHQQAECVVGEMCCGVGPSPSYFCGMTCPISRRAYKEAIEYLDDEARRRVAAELQRFRLGTYRYKADPAGAPRRLGFIIDDVAARGPSPAVAPDGEHVDVYGYASMAVAALQEQQREIEALRAEVRALRAELRATGKAPHRQGERR